MLRIQMVYTYSRPQIQGNSAIKHLLHTNVELCELLASYLLNHYLHVQLKNLTKQISHASAFELKEKVYRGNQIFHNKVTGS